MSLILDNAEASARHLNISASGWTRVGSLVVPTNTTAGDLTAARLFVPDGALLTGLISQFGGPIGVTAAGEFRFYNAGNTFYVGFKGPAAAANKIWTLPLADGAASTFLQTDGGGTLIFAAPATQTSALLDGTVHTDTLAGSVADGDTIIGNVTPKWSRLAITIPAANILEVLGVVNGELRPSWKGAMDATAPTTQAFGDAADAGTGVLLSRVTHKHAMPANPVSANGAIRTITFVIDGGGSAITAGIKGDLEIPFACTVNGWTILADQDGAIVVDIWKDTYANFPPTVADTITGTELPTITATGGTDIKNQDLTLTTWGAGVNITAGDILRFNVNSCTSMTRVTLSLKVTET